MISFSIMFHVASAAGFLVLGFLLAKSNGRIRFMRRLMNSGPAIVTVGRPDDLIKLFCDALAISFQQEDRGREPLSKVVFSSLLAGHIRCGIRSVRLAPGERLQVFLTLQNPVQWAVNDTKAVESDFSGRVAVVLE